MTSSATQDFLSEITGDQVIPVGKLGYFRARLAGRVHQMLLKLYGKLEHERNLTRRKLARRIHRKPEQITRWLSYPSNLTLDTASDLFIGLGYEIEQVILVDVATGQKIALPEVHQPENASVRNSQTQRPHTSDDNTASREGKVIDLMEALRLSLEKSQKTKAIPPQSGSSSYRESSSALSQVGITAAPHQTLQGGLAAQNQLHLRSIPHTLEKIA